MTASANPRDPVVPTVSLRTLAARKLLFRDPKTVQQPLSTQAAPSTLAAISATPTLRIRVQKETNVSQHRGAVNGMLRGWIRIHSTTGSLPSSAQGSEPGLVWQAVVDQMKTMLMFSMVMP